MASLGNFAAALRVSFGQSRSRRTLAMFTAIAAVAVAMYVNHQKSGGPYEALFPNLQQDDAASVINQLKASGVDYRVDNNGTTISVPAKMAPELRMKLAQMSLPTNGAMGFEWFDKPPIGMTDRVQQINYVRALQGELARSISTLASVERAKVILALPERTAFLRNEESKPSASVVLELRRGNSLTPSNVEGILNLVSRAVEGLQPDRIALIDARTGESLSKSYQKPEDVATDQNLAFQRRYEQDLERNLESMLERWVGKGRVVARVNAAFDFQQTKVVKRSYNDDDKALESETMRAEGAAASSSPGGKVGSPTQIPGQETATPAQAAALPGDNGSLVTEKRYKVTQVDTTTVSPMGGLKRLTVAVMVDYKSQDQAAGADPQKAVASAPRTKEELLSFENLVRKTVGYTADLADTMDISVECVPFDKTTESMDDTAISALERRDTIRYIVTWVVYALLGLLIAFFIARPILQALVTAVSTSGPMRPALAQGSPEALEELEGPAAIRELADPARRDEAARLLRRAETASVNKQAEDLLKTDPARAAALVRKWLEERN